MSVASSVAGSDGGPARLGNLNAANASDLARANASSNSTVGQIAAYEAAVAGGISEADAAAILSEISNRSVDESVVAAVNQLLGTEVSDDPGGGGDTGDGTDGGDGTDDGGVADGGDGTGDGTDGGDDTDDGGVADGGDGTGDGTERWR